MHLLSLLKFFAVLCQMREAESHLLVKPEDATAETGGRASFNCSINTNEGIRWLYATETNSEMQDHIYSGGFTYPQWRKRFNVVESATWFFILTIDPVVLIDAGYYSCMDINDDSYGEAMLVVTHIPEWTTTESLSDSHTSEHSVTYKGFTEHIIVGLCLLIIVMGFVGLCQWKCFKSGKLFRAESENEKHQVLFALPTHIKCLLAMYINSKRNSGDDFEAASSYIFTEEKCTTKNEEVIYAITE